MDWFDETLDDYYNRRKNEIKDELKTLQTIRKMKSVNLTLNNSIGHQLMFNNTAKFVYCISTYTHSVNNEQYEKNLREQRYNKNLAKNNSFKSFADNIINSYALM